MPGLLIDSLDDRAIVEVLSYLRDTAAEIQPSCGSSARVRTFHLLRALVFLRDGLTADSPRRTSGADLQ